MLLPRSLGHPPRVPRVARPDQSAHNISSPSPSPPPVQVERAFPLPSHSTPTLGDSPAIVGFNPDLVRMVPAAAACDRVSHGTAVPLGRHLFTPPPQRRRPRLRGARRAPRGTPLPEPPPEPRLRLAYLSPPPAARTQGSARRGSRNRAAPPAARAQHASPPGPLPLRLLQRPTFRGRAGATIDPTQGAATPGWTILTGARKRERGDARRCLSHQIGRERAFRGSCGWENAKGLRIKSSSYWENSRWQTLRHLPTVS